MRTKRRTHGRGRRASEGSEVEAESFAAALAQRSDHKVRQLCREVERTLAGVLGGDLGDGSLGSLVVASVDPAPDGTRLMVTLVGPPGLDAGPLLERLRNLSGWLRAEIASVIQRKRTPELAFCIIAEGGEEPS